MKVYFAETIDHNLSGIFKELNAAQDFLKQFFRDIETSWNVQEYRIWKLESQNQIEATVMEYELV